MSNLRKANEKSKKGFTATKVYSKKFDDTDLNNSYNENTSSYCDNIITLVELYTDETTEVLKIRYSIIYDLFYIQICHFRMNCVKDLEYYLT